MKVLLSWLREFAPDIDGDPVDLGDKLSALGLAVEDMAITGEGLDGIVVAKVLGLRPHPDADKIQLVDVDMGDGEALQVCCGAFNMSVGDLIPFATIGTVMPNGMEIAQRKMRGEMSNGMCCSAAELGMGDYHDGIMILGSELGAGLGAPITEALGIEPDVLWDLEVNANRPDAMSVAGVARDLAATLGVPFSFPDHGYSPTGGPVTAEASVEIVDPSLCGRFLARTLHGIKIGESPHWIQRRLIALGMRPINSVVDVSNYVMLELGQPNHTYDLALVPDGHIRVRRATEAGETLTTLDGVERRLVAPDGVIADRNDRAIGIAGVMGGLETEIGDSTTSVLLEMAWWDPPSISRTIKRLNLPSEAGTRYRRGVDWGDNMIRAVDRFCQLIGESGATTTEGTIDEAGTTPDRSPRPVRVAKVNSILGTELTGDEMADHLESIGFAVADRGQETMSVTIPTWRWDNENEQDIAEEVGRLHGFMNIERTVPKPVQNGGLSPYQVDRRAVRSALIGAGCDEIQPMPFLAPGDLAKAGLAEDGVTLTNPLVHEESVLRTSLLPGHLKAIAYNQSHRSGPVQFFEIDHVFLPAPADQLLPDEREYLAVSVSEAEATRAVALLDVIDATLAPANLQLRSAAAPGLHPTRTAEVVIAGRVRGHVGEVDPAVCEAYGVSGRVAWIELDLGAILEGPHGNRKYTPVSKFPSSDIDLAFEVPDSVSAAAVAGALQKGGGRQLVAVDLFDSYRGTGVSEGARSLAFRLRFQAHDRTLTDQEVGELRAAAITAAQKQGATLR